MDSDVNSLSEQSASETQSGTQGVKVRSKKPILEIIIFVLVIGIAVVIYFFDLFGLYKESSPENIIPTPKMTLSATLAVVDGVVQLYETDPLSNGFWSTVTEPEEIKEGTLLRTGDSSKAIIEISDGSAIHLNANTEVTFANLSESEFLMTQTTGETFHQVVKSSTRSYIVRSGNVNITAMGTVFDVAKNSTSDTNVLVLESSVAISSGELMESVEVPSGDKITITEQADDLSQTQTQITGEELDNAWFTYIKEVGAENIDQLGILANVTPPALTLNTPANNYETTTATVEVKGTTDPTATVKINDLAVENLEGQFSKVIDLAKGKNLITVKAYLPSGAKSVVEVNVTRSVPAPTATSKPLPTSTPVPSGTFSITSFTSPQPGKVTVSWNVEGYDLAQGFKVIFSKNANPEYPPRDGDFATYVDASVRTVSYEGSTLTDGGIFHARVCRYWGGVDGKVCDLYTPDATVTVAASEWGMVELLLTLGSQSNRNLNFSWDVSGSGQTSLGYKVVWANTPNPTYPQNQQSSNSKTNLWDRILSWFNSLTKVSAETTNMVWGYAYYASPTTRSAAIELGTEYASGTWYFRVCRYRGGYCDVYSNQVEVTIN